MTDIDEIEYPEATSSPSDWRQWCLQRLAAHERSATHDPLGNSVWRLAYELYEALETGRLNEAKLSQISKTISDDALLARAQWFADSHHDCSLSSADIEALLSPYQDMSFDVMREHLERPRAGVVFTAHPTFALSKTLRRAIGRYASAEDDKDKQQAADVIENTPHAPDENITLALEHAEVQSAIERAAASLRNITREILGWAKKRYPGNWTELSPAPLTIASWVGYDLDGRTDIHWGQTFQLRLQEKAAQLLFYAYALSEIDLGENNQNKEDIVEQLTNAAALAGKQSALFATDLNDPNCVVAAANLLSKEDPHRLISLKDVISGVSDLIKAARNDEARLALCVLRAEMQNFGLGVARIHLRINAAQLRSALRADLGIDDARNFIERRTLTAAAEKAARVSALKINTASIFMEQMTARRQLMLCAQILKHIDSDTPIRFLIAECEAPATVMGAVYLARLYGIDHRLDISPLFETPEAMERGGRFMERLLDEPEFVSYIRARGCVAIQIGFSDSGRFMGQVAANLAIERLQILLARALADRGIQDVAVLIFNTHGESMGRGALQESLQDRFDYLMTPWTRARFDRENLDVVTECSFQGGDGFLHFETDHLAAETVGALLRWSFEKPTADRRDCFYRDINFSWDFYRGIKNWQEALFENTHYHRLITAFAPNFLVVSGSRKARRQSGAAITGPRSLRAIPHNAILQQLAAPANVFGGAGAASVAEIDNLMDHIRGSDRMRQILEMIRRARQLTSLPVLRSYASTFDPGFWINKAAADDSAKSASICEEIAAHLSDNPTSAALEKMANHFAAELMRLDYVLNDVYGKEYESERYAYRKSMHALHAIRQGLIMRGLFLTASLPNFSQRHDLTRKALFELAFAARFDEIAQLLEEIFPAHDAGRSLLEGMTEQSELSENHPRGYPEIHSDIIEPLKSIQQLLREIGVGLSHYYRAYG